MDSHECEALAQSGGPRISYCLRIGSTKEGWHLVKDAVPPSSARTGVFATTRLLLADINFCPYCGLDLIP